MFNSQIEPRCTSSDIAASNIPLQRQNHTKPQLRTNLCASPGGAHVMSVWGRQEGVTPSYPIKPMINALLSWEQLSQPQ